MIPSSYSPKGNNFEYPNDGTDRLVNFRREPNSLLPGCWKAIACQDALRGAAFLRLLKKRSCLTLAPCSSMKSKRQAYEQTFRQCELKEFPSDRTDDRTNWKRGFYRPGDLVPEIFDNDPRGGCTGFPGAAAPTCDAFGGSVVLFVPANTARSRFRCSECPSPDEWGGIVFAAIGLFGATLIGLSGYAWLVSKKIQATQMWVSSFSIIWYHAVTISIIGSLRLAWPPSIKMFTATLSISFFGIEFVNPQCILRALGPNAYQYFTISRLFVIFALLILTSILSIILRCCRCGATESRKVWLDRLEFLQSIIFAMQMTCVAQQLDRSTTSARCFCLSATASVFATLPLTGDAQRIVTLACAGRPSNCVSSSSLSSMSTRDWDSARTSFPPPASARCSPYSRLRHTSSSSTLSACTSCATRAPLRSSVSLHSASRAGSRTSPTASRPPRSTTGSL